LGAEPNNPPKNEEWRPCSMDRLSPVLDASHTPSPTLALESEIRMMTPMQDPKRASTRKRARDGLGTMGRGVLRRGGEEEKEDAEGGSVM